MHRKFFKNCEASNKLDKKGSYIRLENGTTECIRIIKSEAHNSTYTKLPGFHSRIPSNYASDFAIGVVLSQSPVGQDRLIAYASRILSKTK